jgi:hypoxanthine phosphoribosyltransferase
LFCYPTYGENFDTKNIVICAADIGGAKTARKISEKLGCTSAIVEKVRPEAGVSYAMSLVGNVSGKTCIIIDDIIDTAGTLCNASDMLMQNGANSVVAYASHGIFSGQAFERIERSSIAKVFVSNTIFQENIGKIEKVDVSTNEKGEEVDTYKFNEEKPEGQEDLVKKLGELKTKKPDDLPKVSKYIDFISDEANKGKDFPEPVITPAP